MDTGFVSKAEIRVNPLKWGTLMLVIPLFVFGISLQIAERNYLYDSEVNWNYLWNGMWCALQIMVTVGKLSTDYTLHPLFLSRVDRLW